MVKINIRIFPLLIMFGLIFASSLTLAGTAEVSAVDELGVIYPHSTDFAEWVFDDFKVWYLAETGNTITITETALDSSAAADRVRGWNGTNPEDDIIWGGGRFNFELMRANGFDFSVTDESLNLLHRYKVPEHDNFNEFLGGWNLWDNTNSTLDPSWYAAAVSGFGFMYNTEYLTANNLPTPTTWDDLTKYDYFGHIVMADPSASGSTTASVLQMLMEKNSQTDATEITSAADMTEAWEFWAKLTGNVGEFTSSSSQPPAKVAAGDYGIGIVIDYFAWEKMASNPVEFSYGGATTVSPDPVAIIKNAPNLDQAKKFMDYLTSTSGQNRVGKFRTPANTEAQPPSDGPVKAAFDASGNPNLSNFPVITPYSADLDGALFSRARLLFTQWFVLNAEKQRDAWDAIGKASGDEQTDALVEYLKLPSNFDGTISGLLSLDRKDTAVTDLWTDEGAANFDKAKDIASPDAGIPGFEVMIVLLPLVGLPFFRRRKR